MLFANWMLTLWHMDHSNYGKQTSLVESSIAKCSLTTHGVCICKAVLEEIQSLPSVHRLHSQLAGFKHNSACTLSLRLDCKFRHDANVQHMDWEMLMICIGPNF